MDAELQLYRDDCLAVMPTLRDDSLDLVLTDPPFFVATSRQSTRHKQRNWSDLSIYAGWWDRVCHYVDRLLKPTGHFLVFCNAESYPALFPLMYNRWDVLRCLVWDKGRPGLGTRWRHQHELIIAARHKAGFDPDDDRLRTDVLRFAPVYPPERLHQSEKPQALLEELINATCPPRGSVGDFFMGSGATGAACVKLRHPFVGVEKDPLSFEKAEGWIRHVQRTGKSNRHSRSES